MNDQNVATSFFRFVSMHTFDRQTDWQTDWQKGLGNIVSCITCSRTAKSKSMFTWSHRWCWRWRCY